MGCIQHDSPPWRDTLSSIRSRKRTWERAQVAFCVMPSAVQARSHCIRSFFACRPKLLNNVFNSPSGPPEKFRIRICRLACASRCLRSRRFRHRRLRVWAQNKNVNFGPETVNFGVVNHIWSQIPVTNHIRAQKFGSNFQ